MLIRKILGSILLLLFAVINTAGAMTSTNYQINFDSINSGGTDFSSSTSYQMNDTFGEQGTGYSSSSNHLLHAGYRQSDEGFEPSLSFEIGVQENSTQTTYSALSLAAKTVTVADATDYATGSYIGVVENQGLGQNFVIGRITDVLGSVIYVDAWEGTTSTIGLIPAGGDDYVYRMDNHNLDFGNMNYGVGYTGIVYTNVNTTAENGFTVQIQSDGYFNNGTEHIVDVSDGTVSTDAEEYGARVYGYHATSTGFDFPVTSTFREIQMGTSTASNSRVGMIYKINTTPVTPAGYYRQTVRYIVTANF
ncbi:MAG: hypothetical protein ACOYUZ_04265 [Patescibacteria group bacterium]